MLQEAILILISLFQVLGTELRVLCMLSTYLSQSHTVSPLIIINYIQRKTKALAFKLEEQSSSPGPSSQNLSSDFCTHRLGHTCTQNKNEWKQLSFSARRLHRHKPAVWVWPAVGALPTGDVTGCGFFTTNQHFWGALKVNSPSCSWNEDLIIKATQTTKRASGHWGRQY